MNGVRPGRAWRYARRLAQALAWIAMFASPLLGGWQRSDALASSAWTATEGWDLAPAVNARAPDKAHALADGNFLEGGGAGVVYFGIPMSDPVAGLMGLTRALPSLRAAVALAVPLLLALLFGRIFCGWFCPFGTLSRLLRRLVNRLPKGFPRYQLGARRPVRWVVLGACLIGGAVGSQLVVTLALPHLVLSQSIYSLWLQGGGGALLGWFAGLVVAGLALGPTTFCAAVCPTGALLALAGRFRPARLRIRSVEECGRSCRRCDLACWLSLHPASGDAGADCDNCGRCFQVCPHDNLRVSVGRGTARALPIVTTLLLFALPASAIDYMKPELTIDEHREHEGVNIAVGVLNMSAVRLSADSPDTVGGSEIIVRFARGERGADDHLGRAAPREHYAGALVVQVRRGGATVAEARWDKPNYPTSTVRRKNFRKRVDHVVAPGDEVVVMPATGFTSTPAVFTAPDPASGHASPLWFFVSGLLMTLGLLAVSLAVSERPTAGSA